MGHGDTTSFKTPVRLESMMQDYPRLLENKETTQVGFTMYDRWFCYSPAKNNLSDAKALVEFNLPSYGAA